LKATPALQQRRSKNKVEPVSPENVDEWVYEFSNENMSGISHAAQKKAKQHRRHRHHKNKNIAFLQYNKEAGLWMTNQELV